ncbi:MAG: fibronectin type III domain-containing protein, partial [Terriglobales bacterium]
IEVFVHDIFPPAVPTGLEAVSSGTPPQPFIDLSWAPNTESDLAGYNVYRHEEGEEPKKINGELVKGPTYRDSAVQAGHRYWYSVSAVDLRGNESGKSAEAFETVPR